jgi:hypothetical protein
MSDLEKAMKERLLRMINEHPFSGAPPINIYNGMHSSVSEAMSAGGSNSVGNQINAQKRGDLSPEDLEYLVDISKRDVKAHVGEDEEGNPIYKTVGWDKKVHRYTEPNADVLANWDDSNINPDNPEVAMQGERQKGKREQRKKGLGSLFGEAW